MREAKRKKGYWPDKETKILVELYPITTPQDLQEALPMYTPEQISNKAVQLGVKKTKEYKSKHSYKREPVWSDADSLRLIEIYPNATKKELKVAFPDKSLRQMYSKAQKIGIRRTYFDHQDRPARVKPIIKEAMIARALKSIKTIFTPEDDPKKRYRSPGAYLRIR